VGTQAEKLGEDDSMATTTTTIFAADLGSGQSIPASEKTKRRSIDPQSGQALVILGHAIEYLADEFVCGGRSFSTSRGQVDAIQLLMALNREIYLACPEAPTFAEWLKAGLRRLLRADPRQEHLRLQH
jgi:hypothetical protein